MEPKKVLPYVLALICIVLAVLLVMDKKKCESCHLQEQEILNPTESMDFSLKIDYTNESDFQVFQYDIANSYSIMGRIKLDPSNNSIIEKIDFMLYEAGTCKRYGVKKVSYEQHDLGHLLDVNIESLQNTGTNTSLVERIPIVLGQDIYVRIKSEDFPNIRTYLPEELNLTLGNTRIKEPEKIVRHFPPLICPAKIYEGFN